MGGPTFLRHDHYRKRTYHFLVEVREMTLKMSGGGLFS